MPSARKLVLLLVATAAAACTDPPNFQRLPIGSRCGATTDCGSAPFGCDLTPPGGYCTKDCTTSGDCPQDAECVSAKCRRACTSSSQCRPPPEKYACVAAGASRMVCEYQP